KTLAEFIAYAKANPGKVNHASAGTGSAGHLAGELFSMMTGIKMVHVPYRVASAAMADLIGGQVDVLFAALPGWIDHIRSGTPRALAVTTATRSAALPDVPSAGETVQGFESSGWFGIGAPKGTAAEIVNTLNHEINAALIDSKMR